MIFRESIITGNEPPSPLYLKGYVKNTNESVLLNGQVVYPVIPKETAKTIQVVIGEGNGTLSLERGLTGHIAVTYRLEIIFRVVENPSPLNSGYLEA